MAQLVESVAFKSAKNIESVMCRPLVTVSFMPFAGNRFKIVYGIRGSNALGIALRLAGVVMNSAGFLNSSTATGDFPAS